MVSNRRKKLVALWESLNKYLGDQELRDLCFALDVDYDDLPAEGKTYKARELITFLERRDRIPELVQEGRNRRPDITWDSALEKAREASEKPQETSDKSNILPQHLPSKRSRVVLIVAAVASLIVMLTALTYWGFQTQVWRPIRATQTAIVQLAQITHTAATATSSQVSPSPTRTSTATLTPVASVTPTITSTPTWTPTPQPTPFQSFEENNGTQGVYFTGVFSMSCSFSIPPDQVYEGTRAVRCQAQGHHGGTVRIYRASPRSFDLSRAETLYVRVYDTQGDNDIELRFRDSRNNISPKEQYSVLKAARNTWSEITWDLSKYDFGGLDKSSIDAIELYEWNDGTYYFDFVGYR